MRSHFFPQVATARSGVLLPVTCWYPPSQNALRNGSVRARTVGVRASRVALHKHIYALPYRPALLQRQLRAYFLEIDG